MSPYKAVTSFVVVSMLIHSAAPAQEIGEDPAPGNVGKELAEFYKAPELMSWYSGKASASGTIRVGRMGPAFATYDATVSVGEDIESIRQRLQEAVLNERMKNSDFLEPGEKAQKRIRLLQEVYFVAGDDVGFATTPAPRGLTGFGDWNSKTINLRWLAGDGAIYESLRESSGLGYPGFVDPPTTSTKEGKIVEWVSVYNGQGTEPGQYLYSLVGYQNSIPSAPSTIFVDICRFIEATDPPFVHGLHPNWERVALAGQPAPRLSEGFRDMKNQEFTGPRKVPGGWVTSNDGPKEDANGRREQPWMRDPGRKKRFQVMEQPTGSGAVRRRILAEHFDDRFTVSILLRSTKDGARAPIGDVAYVWNGPPEELEKVVAAGAEAVGTHPNMTRLEPTGNPDKFGWTEYSTVNTALDGVAPSDSGFELSLVIIARDRGDARLDFDWLKVEKLNCESVMPEGYDPWGPMYSTEIDPETGKSVDVRQYGHPRDRQKK